ncbi:class I SAM-dependent methyltransferase [Alkalibacterium kapii]|uniref:DNA methyltransferase n=1 Tax=Alkalibacterium kapii TaxID=426704 RepID=A0A511ATP8_9LACT|nr:class I SAM-dependent methyltransferase [Alkalibacterium kapii]GEK91569.1 DNA methyltransferase [Alkalibacterium kapii]
MDLTKVEKFYTVLLESTNLLKEELDTSFIEAFIESGENILDNGTIQVENNVPLPETREKLKKLYESIAIEELSLEEKKKSVQMILINMVKEDQMQMNHQPTPDGIGVILSHFIDLFFEKDTSLHLADLSVGSGNLLYTIFTTLSSDTDDIKLTGVENDELLIALASTLSALLNIPIELMHQDALQPLLLNPVDLVVSDLPVGYYPKQVNEDQFDTAFEEGLSYSHYLLMEQGFNYLKDEGYAFYVLPTSVFEASEVKGLLRYIHSVGHVQAIVHMPLEWFSSEKSRKSLLIVQKKGEESKQASEVLVADVPSVKDKKAFNAFLLEIKQWKEKQSI